MKNRPSILVVVAHYNARAEDQLDFLLFQLRDIPAGLPFDIRVVVNQAHPGPVELARFRPDVEFCYRENTGMNIGAWDFGWRAGQPYDLYVFLQDECLILRAGWLKQYARRAEGGRIIGESMHGSTPWDEWERNSRDFWEGLPESEKAKSPYHSVTYYRDWMIDRGIEPQPTAIHLQSLVLCASRRSLEQIGGFVVPPPDKHEAIASEIAFSQRAMARGLKVEQVAMLPFHSIIHPQWMGTRSRARTPRAIIKALVKRYTPRSLVSLLKPGSTFARSMKRGSIPQQTKG